MVYILQYSGSIHSLSNQINYGILNANEDLNDVPEYNLANNIVSQSFGAFSIAINPNFG